MSRMQSLVALFGLALLVSAGDAAMDLEIKPAGATLAKSKGETFMLTCVATGLDSESNFTPRLDWYGPDNAGRPLTNDDLKKYNGVLDRDEIDNKLKIRFRSIKGDAQGKYTCKAKAEDGSMREAAIHLQLYQKISFDDAPEKQYPVEGTNALIKCVVSGSPAPSVTWKVNGKRVNFKAKGTRYALDDKDRGIIVKSITQADEGSYECRAEVESDGQMKVRNIEVVVNVKPAFKKDYKPEVLNTPIVGQTIQFRCFAKTGKPQPTYHFYKKSAPNDELVSRKDSRYTLTQKTGPNKKSGELEIRGVKAEDDGDYICRAKNDAGDTDVELKLDVIEPPKLIKLDNQVFKNKDQGFLRCEVHGDPKPELSFRKAGTNSPYVLGKQPDDNRISIKHSTTDKGYAVIELMIENLTPTDTNNYTCSAKNSGGSNEWSGTITVQYKPDLSKTENTTFTWIGNTKNITCLSDGEPLPKFTWSHNGEAVTDGSKGVYKVYNENKESNLEIKIPKNSGNQYAWVFGTYTCVATNDIGDDTHNIEVKKAVVPKKPDKVTIARHTPTTITFKAEGPSEAGKMDLIGYIVEYKLASKQGDYDSELIFALNKTIKVYNLKPDTDYQFKISAYNAVGTSEKGIKMDHTTVSIRPPYPVVITSKKTSDRPTVYKIKWQKPDNGGKPITLYKVSYRMVDVDPTNETKIIKEYQWYDIEAKIPGGKRTYTLEHLKSNRYYEVKITAKNDKGESLPKPYIFRTVEAFNPQKPGQATPPYIIQPPPPAKTSDAGSSSGRGSGLSTGAIVGIVIAVFFIFLIIIDVSCYFLHECGILHHICVQFCGKGHTGGKSRESDMEGGMSKELVKNTDQNGDNEIEGGEEGHELQEETNDDDIKKEPLPEDGEEKPEPETDPEKPPPTEGDDMDKANFDHQDELEPDEKAPLTGSDKQEEIPLEDNIKYEETTPSAKASPQGSPKETQPIIA